MIILDAAFAAVLAFWAIASFIWREGGFGWTCAFLLLAPIFFLGLLVFHKVHHK